MRFSFGEILDRTSTTHPAMLDEKEKNIEQDNYERYVRSHHSSFVCPSLFQYSCHPTDDYTTSTVTDVIVHRFTRERIPELKPSEPFGTGKYGGKRLLHSKE